MTKVMEILLILLTLSIGFAFYCFISNYNSNDKPLVIKKRPPKVIIPEHFDNNYNTPDEEQLSIPLEYFDVVPNLDRKIEVRGPSNTKETKYGTFKKPCVLTYLHLQGMVAAGEGEGQCSVDSVIHIYLSITRGSNVVVFRRAENFYEIYIFLNFKLIFFSNNMTS